MSVQRYWHLAFNSFNMKGFKMFNSHWNKRDVVQFLTKQPGINDAISLGYQIKRVYNYTVYLENSKGMGVEYKTNVVDHIKETIIKHGVPSQLVKEDTLSVEFAWPITKRKIF